MLEVHSEQCWGGGGGGGCGFFFFSSRRRHTRSLCDWSSDVCSSDLINPHPTDFCIPDHPQAELQMYGLVCFNEGQLALERNGAKEEAQTVTKAIQDIGIKTGNSIKNWSTYSLLTGLRKFCEDIRDKFSLAVVCIMTHRKAGLLYSNTSSSDSCQISDIFNILGERLPQVIPKVIPFCYILSSVQ